MLLLSLFLLLLVEIRPAMAVSDVKTKVILISMDGFRYDYLEKTNNKRHFESMISSGVSVPYVNNTFITNTFPCHYSIATGLYSETHGIVGNRMYDPEFDSYFSKSNTEPRWWEGGEPIWITVRKAGLKSGVFFWPGSESEIHGVRPNEYRPYSNDVPYELRVETVVSWMAEDDFDFGILYFNEPDSTGHAIGPEDPAMVPVIERMNSILGYLFEKLKEAGLEDKVNIILTSDHGMTTVDTENKTIDLALHAGRDLVMEVVDSGSTAQIRPQQGKAKELVDALSNVEHLNVMLKEDIPDRFHLKHNRRVMDVFAYADEGWTIFFNISGGGGWTSKGNHGYDNQINTMKPFFMAQGPAFKKGFQGEPISSLDIYPLICHLLDIKTAPNNGSLDRAMPLLNSAINTAPSVFFMFLISFSVVFSSIIDS